ncbi:hypothetical protein [Zunongwangia atlantica]|uniref:Knr4/Smi1-like domain-containing protein n=1 Tax=Zunongwangia atlantica 22II14-10F7 TaxID=1185767 RepID=A0A1Y1SY39_9FLAO|nr:hypothetical protein [Zunongwangia atlantica]ORL43482.1 hypothetical protein IIF7_20591 [Zunongwangia atlantica 22II14-10F7]
MWKPITEKELSSEICKAEAELEGKYLNFWNLINISPEKWSEPTFGNEGGGFWVIAICGRKIIWFNDIEDGFNISDYTEYGKIDGYYCNQDELKTTVLILFEQITFGGQIIG